MSILKTLLTRSDSKCELCGSQSEIHVFEVPPVNLVDSEHAIAACDNCLDQLNNENTALDPNHWRCLNDAMWNPITAVQVVSWRLLTELNKNGEAWAADLLELFYFDDETLAWANAMQNNESDAQSFDSNGTVLLAGDAVTLIKDLDVKGANFTAKRGTLVKNITLTENPQHIEGKVNGTRIVLLTQFLKRSN